MQSYMQKKFKDGCVSRLAANMAGFITWYGDRTKISSVCVRGYPRQHARISSTFHEDILTTP